MKERKRQGEGGKEGGCPVLRPMSIKVYRTSEPWEKVNTVILKTAAIHNLEPDLLNTFLPRKRI